MAALMITETVFTAGVIVNPVYAADDFGTEDTIIYEESEANDFEIDLKEPQWISGFYYYHSSKIEDLWTFGWHNVAPFESNCARYVAKYTSKNKSKIIMSRNLGRSYYDRYFLQIAADNFKLYGDFGSSTCVSIP